MDTKLLEHSVGDFSHAKGPSHAFSCGDMVVIFRIALFGRPFIEGRASIVAPVPETPDLYLVQFIGDPRVRTRFAHPEFQNDPARMLQVQLDNWRKSMDPEILDEFFPDDR